MTAQLDRTDDTAVDGVERALRAIAAGKPIVLIDNGAGECEGDMVFAADFATTALVAFVVRYSSGFLCIAIEEAEAERLDIPPVTPFNQNPRKTAFAVSVDVKEGTTTGISAADRARTIRHLSDPSAQADDFTRPGHVVPVIARPGGVLARPGHTEAALDLAALAGCKPAAAMCKVVSERNPDRMADGPELRDFAARFDLAVVSVADVMAYRNMVPETSTAFAERAFQDRDEVRSAEARPEL